METGDDVPPDDSGMEQNKEMPKATVRCDDEGSRDNYVANRVGEKGNKLENDNIEHNIDVVQGGRNGYRLVRLKSLQIAVYKEVWIGLK